MTSSCSRRKWAAPWWWHGVTSSKPVPRPSKRLSCATPQRPAMPTHLTCQYWDWAVATVHPACQLLDPLHFGGLNGFCCEISAILAVQSIEASKCLYMAYFLSWSLAEVGLTTIWRSINAARQRITRDRIAGPIHREEQGKIR